MSLSSEVTSYQYGDWNKEPQIIVYMGETLSRHMTLQEVLDRSE